MSRDLITDIHNMHAKYGVHKWVAGEIENDEWSRLHKFMDFRLKFIQEELDETVKAHADQDKEELVDGLIDIVVVALGTLDAFGVDTEKAWNEVLKANMQKEVGQKETRPNPLGLPDLIKPEGWKGPNHGGNTGCI